MLPSMIETIKQAAIDAVESLKPVAVLPATVTSTEPLEFSVEQRMTLTKEFLILTETARKISFSVGDSVLLLRVQGGQKFVILDRM